MTNEEYIKAIDMRTSRRTYKARALDKSILEVLKNMVDAVNEASGLEFQLVEDGTPALEYLVNGFCVFDNRDLHSRFSPADFRILQYAAKTAKRQGLKAAIGESQSCFNAFIMVWVPAGFQALMMKIKFTKQLICPKSTGFMP